MRKAVKNVGLVMTIVLLSMALIFGAVAEEADGVSEGTITSIDGEASGTDDPSTGMGDVDDTGDVGGATDADDMDNTGDVGDTGDVDGVGDAPVDPVPGEGQSALKIVSVVRRKATEEYPAFGSLEKLNLGENFAVTVTDQEGVVLTEDVYTLSWTLKDPALPEIEGEKEPTLRIGDNTVYIKATPKSGYAYASAVSEAQTLTIVPRTFTASLKLNYTFEKEEERQYFSDNYELAGLNKGDYTVTFTCANGNGATLMIPSTPGIYRVEAQAQVKPEAGYPEGTYTIVNFHWDNVRVYKAVSAILPSSQAVITLPYVESGYTPSGIIGVSASVPGLKDDLYTVEYTEVTGREIKDLGDYLVHVKVVLNDEDGYYLLEGETETTVPVSIIQTEMIVEAEQKLTSAISYDVTTPADVAQITSVKAKVSGTPALKEGKDYRAVYTLDGEEVPADQVIPVGEHTITVEAEPISQVYASAANQVQTFAFRAAPVELTVTYAEQEPGNYVYEDEVNLCDLIHADSIVDNGDVDYSTQVQLKYVITKDGTTEEILANGTPIKKVLDAGMYTVQLTAEVKDSTNYSIVNGAASNSKSFTVAQREIKVTAKQMRTKLGKLEVNQDAYKPTDESILPFWVEKKNNGEGYTEIEKEVGYTLRYDGPDINDGKYALIAHLGFNEPYDNRSNYSLNNQTSGFYVPNTTSQPAAVLAIVKQPVEVTCGTDEPVQQPPYDGSTRAYEDYFKDLTYTVRQATDDGSYTGTPLNPQPEIDLDQITKAYTIKDESNNTVTEIKDAGTYTVTLTLTPSNNLLDQYDFSKLEITKTIEVPKSEIVVKFEEKHKDGVIYDPTKSYGADNLVAVSSVLKNDVEVADYADIVTTTCGFDAATTGKLTAGAAHDADTYGLTFGATLKDDANYDLKVLLGETEATTTEFTISKLPLVLSAWKKGDQTTVKDVSVVYAEGTTSYTMADYFEAKLATEDGTALEASKYAVSYSPATVTPSGRVEPITVAVDSVNGETGSALAKNYTINDNDAKLLAFAVTPQKIVATAAPTKAAYIYQAGGYQLGGDSGIFPVTLTLTDDQGAQTTLTAGTDYTVTYKENGNAVTSLEKIGQHPVTPEVTLTNTKYTDPTHYSLDTTALTEQTIEIKAYTAEVTCSLVGGPSYAYMEAGRPISGILKTTVDILDHEGTKIETLDPAKYDVTYTDAKGNDIVNLTDGGDYTIAPTVTLKDTYAATDADGNPAYVVQFAAASAKQFDVTVTPLEIKATVAQPNGLTFIYDENGYALGEILPVELTLTDENGTQKVLSTEEADGYTVSYADDGNTVESIETIGQHPVTPSVSLTGKYATAANYKLDNAELTEQTFEIKPFTVKVTCSLKDGKDTYVYAADGHVLSGIILTQVEVDDIDATTPPKSLTRDTDYTVAYSEGGTAIDKLTDGRQYVIEAAIALTNGYEITDSKGTSVYQVVYDGTETQTINVTTRGIDIAATMPKGPEFTYVPEKDAYKLAPSADDTGIFPVTVSFTNDDGTVETLNRVADGSQAGYTLTYALQNGTTAVATDKPLENESLTNRGTYVILPVITLTGEYADEDNYKVTSTLSAMTFTVNPRQVSVEYTQTPTEYVYRKAGYALADILPVKLNVLNDDGAAETPLTQGKEGYAVSYQYTHTPNVDGVVETSPATLKNAGTYQTTTLVELTGSYASTNASDEPNYVFADTDENTHSNDLDMTVKPCELGWSVAANEKYTTGEDKTAYEYTYRKDKGIPMSDALVVAVTGFEAAGLDKAPESDIQYAVCAQGVQPSDADWKTAKDAKMGDANVYSVGIRANLTKPLDQNNFVIAPTSQDLTVTPRKVAATQTYLVGGKESETAEELWYRPDDLGGAHEIAKYIGVTVETVPFEDKKLDEYYGTYELQMVDQDPDWMPLDKRYGDTYAIGYVYSYNGGDEIPDKDSIQEAGTYAIHEKFEYNGQNYLLNNLTAEKVENGGCPLELVIQPREIELAHVAEGFVYDQTAHELSSLITLSTTSTPIKGYPKDYYPTVTMDDAAFKAICESITYLAEGKDTFGKPMTGEDGSAKVFTAISEAGDYTAWEAITLSDPNYALKNQTNENRAKIRIEKATINAADNKETDKIVYNGQERPLNAGEIKLTSEKVVASTEGCKSRVPATDYLLTCDKTIREAGDYTLALKLAETCNNYQLAQGGVTVTQHVLRHPVAALVLAGGVRSDERNVQLFGGETPGTNHTITLTGEPGESVDIVLTSGNQTLCETTLLLEGDRFANGDDKAAQTASLSFQFADTADGGAVLTIGEQRIAIHNNGSYALSASYTDKANLTDAAASLEAQEPKAAQMAWMWDKTRPEVTLNEVLRNRDRQTTVNVSEACTLNDFKVGDIERISEGDKNFTAQGAREYTLNWSLDSLMHSGEGALTITTTDLVGNTNTQTFDVERSKGAPITLNIQPIINDNGYVDRSEVQVDYVAIYVDGTAGELIEINQNGKIMTSTSGNKLPMLSRTGTEWAVDKLGSYSGEYSSDSFPNFEEFLLSVNYEDLEAPQAEISLIYDDICLPTVVASVVSEDCRVISCLAERGAYLSFYRNGEWISVQGRIDNYGVFVGSMPYLEKGDVLKIVAVDLAGNIDKREIIVGEEVASASLDGYLMGRTAIGYVDKEMDWATASYLRIDELKAGVTLPLVAANAFIYGQATVRMDEDGQISVETELNEGVKAEGDYVGVLTTFDMDSFKHKTAGSKVTDPKKVRDGVWVCFSQSVELSAADMSDSYLLWRDTTDENYLLYLNRQRSAELSTLIF